MNARVALLVAAGAVACGSGSHESAEGAASAVSTCDGSTESAPLDIACTGLYAQGSTTELAAGVRPFAPATPLWSDGAGKSRWVYLPDGQIDTANPDAWVYPVGTKAWKDFSVQGKRIETRFFWKVSDTKWVRATYVWSDDEKAAKRVDSGVPNARGTGFDVPNTEACDSCHGGRKDRLLGFDALGLGVAGATGVTLATLVAENRLTHPPQEAQLSFGNDPVAPALAWLHINCGAACHNANENAKANVTGLHLRTTVDRAWNVSTADVLKTTLGVSAAMPQYQGNVRIVPGNPEGSLLWRLATTRGDQDQMPPVGVKTVDDEGMRAVRDWIAAMPRGTFSAKVQGGVVGQSE